MNSCDQINKIVARASCQMNEKMAALQGKILKLQYSSKAPAQYLVMQELMEDYREHLERYIGELEALDSRYGERMEELKKLEKEP